MTEIQTLTIETVDAPTVIEIATGPRGARGPVWHFGNNVIPDVGGIGDIYLVSEGTTNLGNVYEKQPNGTWLLEGNIRGLGGVVNSVNGLSGADVVVGANHLTTGTLPDARLSANVVVVGGAQTISGVKTFSVAPVVPDGSFTISKITGLQSAIDGKQGVIAAGTASQYYRGDKAWATLDKSAVGLPNVDNTADSAKPVSTAQQSALNLKANLASPTFTGTVSGITKAMVGLGSADNTSDANKPISTATQTALNAKANVSHTHTPSEVGAASPADLTAANVANRNRANHTGTQPAATISGLATVATSGLITDLSGVLPASMLPALAISDTFTPANEAAMLALTAQRGDIAIRVDNGLSYILVTDTPSVLASWKQLMPAGQVASVAGRTGAVVLVKADVGLGNVDNTSDANKPVSTAVQAALNLKAATNHVHSLVSLSDITISNPQSGHVITYNGTAWVNSVVSAANFGAAPSVHGHALTDANITGILPIAQIPTGNTGSTVALGNHTHPYADLTGRPTLGTAAALNVPASGDAAGAEVVKGTDSRLTNARPPIAHNHTKANITDFAHTHSKNEITDFAHTHVIAQLPVADDGLESATLLVRANDSRLSNARPPLAHTHTAAQISDFSAAISTRETASAVQAKVNAGILVANAYTDQRVNAIGELTTREPTIIAGTTAQFWRGDKTWQEITKANVGLGNVDNTSDAAKPVSTATQTALNGKANTAHVHALTDSAITGVLPVAKLPSHKHWVRDLNVWDANEYVPNVWFHPDGEPVANGVILAATATEVPAGAPGAHVLKISSRDNHPFAIPYVTGKPGEMFRIEAWVAAPATTTRNFNIYIFSATNPVGTAGVAAVSAVGNVSPTTTWTKVVFNYTVPVGGAGGKPYIRPVLQVNTVAGDTSDKWVWYVTGFSLKKLNQVSDLPVAASGTSSSVLLVRADDSRLSNARTPLAHSHAIADITSLQSALDAKAASGHGHALTDSNITGVLPIAQIPSTVFHTGHLPEVSEVNGLQTALNAKADTSHKYHEFSNGQYYYDSYEQRRFLRMFTETSRWATLRFRPISNVEYHNGTTWVSWVGGDEILKNMLNGRENTVAQIPHANRKFRFTLDKANGYPLVALITMSTAWTPITYTGVTLTIEDTVNRTDWTTLETCVFNSTTTGATWGTHLKASTALHNGRTTNRFTFDITNWVDIGGYTTFPISGFEIYSNHQGSDKNPWTWGYDQIVNFQGPEVRVQGTNLVKTNDPRLADARTPLAHGHALTDANITGKLPAAQLPDTAFHTGHLPTISEVEGLNSALAVTTAGGKIETVRTQLRETWFAAIARRNYAPVKAMIMGDSISEGYSTTAPHRNKRWIDILRRQLRIRGNQPVGGHGYVPAMYGDPYTSMTNETVITGAAAVEANWEYGFGGKALLLPGTTGNQSTATFPNFTNVKKIRVWYSQAPWIGGAFSVLVNGTDITATGKLFPGGTTSPATVPGVAATSKGGLYWESVNPVPVAAGTGFSTVSIVSRTNGAYAFLTGVEYFYDDDASSIHVYDNSHSGGMTTNFLEAKMAPSWDDVAAVNPDIVVVNLGTNEAQTDRPVATFKAETIELIEKLKVKAPNASVVMVKGWTPGFKTAEFWAPYNAAKDEVASIYPHVFTYDLRSDWPELAMDGSNNRGLMHEAIFPLHPNDVGDQRYADIMTRLLEP